MKTIILLLPLILMISGCGALLDEPADDPRFHPIRDQFVEDAKFFGVDAHTSNIKISFGDVNKRIKYAGFINATSNPDNADAYCQIFKPKSGNDLAKGVLKAALGKKYNLKVIIVSDKHRNESLDFLETVVYHELGHCALNYDHREEDSIMSLGDVMRTGSMRYFYLRELFNRTPLEDIPIGIQSDIKETSELIFESSYEAFGQVMHFQQFFDHSSKKFFMHKNGKSIQ